MGPEKLLLRQSSPKNPGIRREQPPTKSARDAGLMPCPTISCWRGDCCSSGSQHTLHAVLASQALVMGIVLLASVGPKKRGSPNYSPSLSTLFGLVSLLLIEKPRGAG